MSFFGDILKEPTQGGRRFSQGRMYLFISFVAFIALNVLLAVCAFKGIPLEDKESLELVSSNLKWALGSFSLYVLGGKGIGAFRDRDTGISNNYNHEREGGGHHNNPYGGHISNPYSDFGTDSYGGASPSSDVDNDDYNNDYDGYNDSDKQSGGSFGADEEEVN
jgi:hypothetical protein